MKLLVHTTSNFDIKQTKFYVFEDGEEIDIDLRLVDHFDIKLSPKGAICFLAGYVPDSSFTKNVCRPVIIELGKKRQPARFELEFEEFEIRII